MVPHPVVPHMDLTTIPELFLGPPVLPGSLLWLRPVIDVASLDGGSSTEKYEDFSVV